MVHPSCKHADPPHRPAADPFDAGQQLRRRRPAAAALMPGTDQQIAQQHVALGVGGMGLVEHARLAAALAFDAQEP
jgi:hypothetical protein